MLTKICTCCGEEKTLDLFSKKKTGKHGVRSQCKNCLLIKNREYNRVNSDKANARSKRWKINNPDKVLAYKQQYRIEKAEDIKAYRDSRKDADKVLARKWRQHNKDKVNAYGKKWREHNQHFKTANQNRRRTLKLKATAKWDTELTDLVALEAAHLCGLRQKITGYAWHVDHVIPLNGKVVSGLHVWNNLAVIPAAQNLSKGNRYITE
jgi:hypothetical protein